MTDAALPLRATSSRLPAYAAFAGVLAAAGLPIYIHAPKVYAEQYGVSLAALGTALFLLRGLDVVQDPALGWLSARLRHARGAAVALALAVMGGAMVALFAVPPLLPPIWWFALTLALVFSAFSFLTITFYAQGVAKADRLGAGGHLRLARWRESGALVGVCLAAVAPTALMAVTDAPFAIFAAGFAAACALVALLMAGEWSARDTAKPGLGLQEVLSDRLARRLLLLAFVNAAPVAVSSTLFLFYVDDLLAAPGWEGPLLLAFFLAAAAAAPVWTALARRHGTRPVLMSAMILAIAAFGWALTLGAGDTWPFLLICLASGAALGADLTLLPAAFAARMDKVSPGGEGGFGLWGFMSKATLAVTAIAVLPALDAAGFVAGADDNPPEALRALGLAYAGLPCALKLVSITLLAFTDIDGTPTHG